MRSENPRSARRRGGWVLLAVLVTAAFVAAALVVQRTSGGGSADLPSGWVVRENRHPGTSAWRIPTASYGGVEGYGPGRLFVEVGRRHRPVMGATGGTQ